MWRAIAGAVLALWTIGCYTPVKVPLDGVVAGMMMRAQVVLSTEPREAMLPVGQTLTLALYVHAVAADDPRVTSAMSAVLVWDEAVFRLITADDNGPNDWFLSGFLNEPDGINETFDDGNAIYTALAVVDSPAAIPATGLLITTLHFKALTPAASSVIAVVPELGEFGRTHVFDGRVANLDLLVPFGGAYTTVSVYGSEFIGSDLDGDGDIDLADFAVFQNGFTGP